MVVTVQFFLCAKDLVICTAIGELEHESPNDKNRAMIWLMSTSSRVTYNTTHHPLHIPLYN